MVRDARKSALLTMGFVRGEPLTLLGIQIPDVYRWRSRSIFNGMNLPDLVS